MGAGYPRTDGLRLPRCDNHNFVSVRSRNRCSRLVSDPRLSHIDPIVGAPKRNTFLKTAVPFLRRIAR